jgi:hypothetical protein
MVRGKWRFPPISAKQEMVAPFYFRIIAFSALLSAARPRPEPDIRN